MHIWYKQVACWWHIIAYIFEFFSLWSNWHPDQNYQIPLKCTILNIIYLYCFEMSRHLQWHWLWLEGTLQESTIAVFIAQTPPHRGKKKKRLWFETHMRYIKEKRALKFNYTKKRVGCISPLTMLTEFVCHNLDTAYRC